MQRTLRTYHELIGFEALKIGDDVLESVFGFVPHGPQVVLKNAEWGHNKY